MMKKWIKKILHTAEHAIHEQKKDNVDRVSPTNALALPFGLIRLLFFLFY